MWFICVIRMIHYVQNTHPHTFTQTDIQIVIDTINCVLQIVRANVKLEFVSFLHNYLEDASRKRHTKLVWTNWSWFIQAEIRSPHNINNNHIEYKTKKFLKYL